MRTFCNFGAHNQLEAIALGIDGIRLDVPADGALDGFVRQFIGPDTVDADFLLHDPNRVAELLDAIDAAGLEHTRTHIEVFNEPPEKDNVDEVGYVDGVLDVLEVCGHRGYTGRVIAGAKLNLSASSLLWYARTVPLFPEDLTIAFHDYPYGLQSDDLAWPPATWARDPHQAAIDNLRAITGPRPLVCSEYGRHRGVEVRGQRRGGVEERLQEELIYWQYVDRLRLYADLGIVWTAIYQWQDDPHLAPTDSQGLYGLHATDGITRKVQAYALADWRTSGPGGGFSGMTGRT